MTDERISDDALMRALHHLTRGEGVVFRHYGLNATPRQALFDRVRALARRRGLILLLAGTARTARHWGADGWHGRLRGPRFMLHSAPAHDMREIRAAGRSGADMVFVSPVFPTQSHPGGQTLGRVRFAMLARQAQSPVIALGGMTAARGREMRLMGAYGWAAIDGLMRP